MIQMNKGVVYIYSWDPLYSYHYYPGSVESTWMVCIWYIITLFCIHVFLSSVWLCRALSIYGQAYFDIMSQGWQVTALANLTDQKYMPQLLPPLIESQGAWVECMLHWLLWSIPIITQIIKHYDQLCLILYIVLLPPSKKVRTLVNRDIHRHCCTL